MLHFVNCFSNSTWHLNDFREHQIAFRLKLNFPKKLSQIFNAIGSYILFYTRVFSFFEVFCEDESPYSCFYLLHFSYFPRRSYFFKPTQNGFLLIQFPLFVINTKNKKLKYIYLSIWRSLFFNCENLLFVFFK